MTSTRSLFAVLVGIGLFRLVVGALETVLVGTVAGGPIDTEAAYFAVRNRPPMLVAALGYHGVAAFLGGYVMARVAGTRDMMLVGIGAAAQTALLIWAFTLGDYAASMPVWTRVALVLLVGPVMVAGGAVRVRAATNG